MALSDRDLVLPTSLQCFEEMTKKIEEGRGKDVVYMDFNKAFSKVSHGMYVCVYIFIQVTLTLQ